MEQEKPLPSVCACAGLRMAARSATQFYDLVLQPSGLKTTQFIALQSIDKAGELAQCDFAREHAVAIETLSRRLAALRRKGLVTSRTGRHGEHIYMLTEPGKDALHRARPYWERAQKRLERTLGPDEFRVLLQLCQNTVRAVHRAEELRATNSTATPRPEVTPMEHTAETNLASQ
jgi:DNA-binding MarR family transcriptional regulator